MIEKVLQTIKKYNLIEDGDKLVLGVSGGPDSIVMLDILRKLAIEKINFKIVVAHINHLIREESTDDEKYVENYCKKNGIPIYIKRIDVKEYANNNRIGTEEAGRKVRYDFFEEVMKQTNSNKIAIAHNKNDKVETVIMNAIRGSGISGLKGIEPKRDEKYIRPLIECERKEIEKYAKDNNLEPRIDKTNFKNEYTRNKIRNIAIPYVEKELNPNFIETICRLSEVANETENYLQSEMSKIYREIALEEDFHAKKIILDLKKFNKQNILIRKRLLMYAILKVLGNTQNIEKINIEDLIKLCENNIGNKYLMPNKNIKVLVNQGKIFFEALN